MNFSPVRPFMPAGGGRSLILPTIGLILSMGL